MDGADFPVGADHGGVAEECDACVGCCLADAGYLDAHFVDEVFGLDVVEAGCFPGVVESDLDEHVGGVGGELVLFEGGGDLFGESFVFLDGCVGDCAGAGEVFNIGAGVAGECGGYAVFAAGAAPLAGGVGGDFAGALEAVGPEEVGVCEEGVAEHDDLLLLRVCSWGEDAGVEAEAGCRGQGGCDEAACQGGEHEKLRLPWW